MTDHDWDDFMKGTILTAFFIMIVAWALAIGFGLHHPLETGLVAGGCFLCGIVIRIALGNRRK